MNKLQELFCCISGYESLLPFSSAKDDYYFDECETKEEKMEQLESYADEYLSNHALTNEDFEKVYFALEAMQSDEALGSSDKQYTIFENLA